MKKLYILLFTILITSLSFGQTTVLQESFETDGNGSRYTTSIPEFSDGDGSSGGGDFFGRTNLNSTAEDAADLIVGTFYSLSGQDVDFCFAAMDLDAANPTGSGGSPTQTLFFDDINISSYSNLTLAILLAEDQPSDSNFDWDGGDLFYIEVDYDNSGIFTKVLQFATTATTGTNISAPMLDTDIDGIGDGTALTGAFAEFDVALGTGNLVDVRLVFENLGAGDEDISVDNIRIVDGFVAVPTISITSPSDFEVLAYGTTNVDIVFSTANLVGGEQVDITVTKNGGSPVTTNNVLPSPFNIASTADGDTYEVTAELIDGGVIDFETINFSIENTPPTLPINDDFSYADGSLVPNGGWASTDGSLGDLLVSSGQAVVQHGNSEDVSLEFLPVSGNVYYALDFSVDDLGHAYVLDGTPDFEYFAHFKTGFDFSARLDIVPPTSTGDFSVGIASDEGTADIVWATDLTYGVTYRAIVRYDQDTNQAQLWIDASVEGDLSILGEDRPDLDADTVTELALRQSVSDENETVRVDNVYVGTTFGAVLSTRESQIESFKVYPNPTSLGYVNISSKNSETIKATVFDILGKQVINSNVIDNKLDVSNLNQGIYIMRLTQNNATITKKLVIK